MISKSNQHAQLGRAAALVGIGNIVARGSVFVMFAVVSSKLPVEESALAIRILATAAAYGSAVHFCSSAYLARLINLSENSVAKINSAFVFSTFSVPVLSLLCVPIVLGNSADGLAELFGGSYSIAVVSLYLLFVCFGFVDFYTSLFHATGDFIKAISLRVVYAFLNAVGVVVLLVRPGLFLIVYCGCLLIFVVCMLFLSGIVQRLRKDFCLHRRVSEIVTFSAPLVVSALAVNPVVYTVINYVSCFESSDRLVLLVSLNWFGLVMSLPGILSTASLYFFMKGNASVKRLFCVLNLFNFLCITISIAGIFLSKEWLSGLYNVEVQWSTIVLLSAAYPFSVSQQVMNRLVKLGKTWINLLSNVSFGAVFSCSLVVDRWASMSVAKAAFFLLLAHFSRLVVSYYYCLKYERKVQG